MSEPPFKKGGKPFKKRVWAGVPEISRLGPQQFLIGDARKFSLKIVTRWHYHIWF